MLEGCALAIGAFETADVSKLLQPVSGVPQGTPSLLTERQQSVIDKVYYSMLTRDIRV